MEASEQNGTPWPLMKQHSAVAKSEGPEDSSSVPTQVLCAASGFTTLCLSFLLITTGMATIAVTSQGGCKGWDHAREVLTAGLGTKSAPLNVNYYCSSSLEEPDTWLANPSDTQFPFSLAASSEKAESWMDFLTFVGEEEAVWHISGQWDGSRIFWGISRMFKQSRMETHHWN